ncbi:hypothetical protein DSAG12_00194 [Promethearchaeum syntrophicum]|uniref:Uncharacterized protein n=1 Tax=Promethearchaeum syntrophicum TaxID=2594042 RepID=A0A5B9D612_9ARCH|nr:hypothetical protein [Candidatus Prometheoarchaeum syntrophicum]QEE14381.1 hypothetical protein DSAG12_00194 [Candidatus Prometheoarchaeum syntrophicum]
MPPQKKSTKQKQIKIQLTQSPKFIKELRNLFKTNPLIPSASILLEKFKKFNNIPQKWTPNTSIKQLRTDGVIIYSKKKPQGYSLESHILNDHIRNSKTIPHKTSKIRTGVHKSSIKPKKKPDSKIKSKSVSKRKTIAEIVDKIPSIPPYLLKRLSTNEVKILQMGVFDINRLPLQKIDSHIDTLSSARILFDGNYANEKLVSDYIEAKVKYLGKISNKLHEKEDEQLVIKIFIEPMNEGKFDRILKKCMKKYDLDNCASLIIKKVGSKAKKIQLSDFAVRKKIVEVLAKRYSKKK